MTARHVRIGQIISLEGDRGHTTRRVQGSSPGVASHWTLRRQNHFLSSVLVKVEHAEGFCPQ